MQLNEISIADCPLHYHEIMIMISINILHGIIIKLSYTHTQSKHLLLATYTHLLFNEILFLIHFM